jgi:hypothetical protein
MGLAIVLLVVIIFDIVALRWGVDSREKIDSPEWERRKHFLSGGKNKEGRLSANIDMICMPRLSRSLSPCLSDCEKPH